jgi:hypothetical protein
LQGLDLADLLHITIFAAWKGQVASTVSEAISTSTTGTRSADAAATAPWSRQASWLLGNSDKVNVSGGMHGRFGSISTALKTMVSRSWRLRNGH